MNYFRIYEKSKGRSPLGFGQGRGRWNLHGTPLIYCSTSTSLSMLELYTIHGRAVVGTTWELAELEISCDIPRIEKKDLPQDWDRRPYPQSTLRFGTQWASGNLDLCLAVPSIRIPLFRFPEEHNLLLNPLHPAFRPSGDQVAQIIKVVRRESIKFTLNGIKKQEN